MKSWFRQHRFAFDGALATLGRAPGSFFFNVIVVAIALALPFAGLTVLDNVRPLSQQLAVDPEISLFVSPAATREASRALAPSLQKALGSQRAQVTFVSREDALDKLKAKSAMADVLGTLGENPLPDSYVIKLDGYASTKDAAGIDAIAAQLRALPNVDAVHVDSAWVKRLAALLNVLRLVLMLLAVTLGTVVIAVVFNTIRLQVLTQRDEINVAKLLGATDIFIHRPFYYTGALLGLAAGAVALGAVALSLQPLNGAIGEFARLYASEFQLLPLGPLESAGLLAISAGLGLVGAMLSIQRHLARVK
ncbi:permease-like cell division protein FtsX [Massilia cavernae]|uniref:Cell division protein FtsX n=1 Tax=Massilia cavernae TaxID=2320864 RepID=A0A418XAP7_9BURK|nr:permease-like cell division protein FtsX [Massilia cavernae]RJG09438.1 ABC transporter permease [Massilia cavernae]